MTFADRFLAVRPDLHRYSIGLIWLTTLATFTVDPQAVAQFVADIDQFLKGLSVISLPPYGVLLLLVIAVVLLPYCLAEAFKPVTFVVMNLSERVYDKISPRDSMTYYSSARQLALDLDLDTIPSTRAWRMYLAAHSPRLSRMQRSRWTQLMHRASVLFPGALLVSAIVYRMTDATGGKWLPVALAFASFASLFVTGIFQLHTEKRNYEIAEAFCVEMTARERIAARSQPGAP